MIPMQAVLFTLAAAGSVSKIDLSKFIPLVSLGLGRYSAAPALFLAEPTGPAERPTRVMPVPVPLEAVMAIEQAVSAARPSMMEVLLHVRTLANRDDGLYDNLPWQWGASAMAKRDVRTPHPAPRAHLMQRRQPPCALVRPPRAFPAAPTPALATTRPTTSFSTSVGATAAQTSRASSSKTPT